MFFRNSLRGASSLLFLPVNQVPVILICFGHRLLALASMIAGR
jgi:GMP synthase-like glutamine amidotransferase